MPTAQSRHSRNALAGDDGLGKEPRRPTKTVDWSRYDKRPNVDAAEVARWVETQPSNIVTVTTRANSNKEKEKTRK